MNATLDNDPRWARLHDHEWVCPCCGFKHAGPFDLACGKPDLWSGNEEKLSNSKVTIAGNVLTDDFCVLDGEHYFVRGILQIPIIGGSNSSFAFGVWSSLSKKNFDLYVRTFDSGEQGELGPWFSWFSNRLKGYPDTLNLKCQVHPQSARQRPYVEVDRIDHPLALEQQNGVTFDRLLDIYAQNGHDIRGALSAGVDRPTPILS